MNLKDRADKWKFSAEYEGEEKWCHLELSKYLVYQTLW